MPERSVIRKSFGAYGDHELQKVLEEYESEALRVLNYSDSVNDQPIRDMTHLTASGHDFSTKNLCYYQFVLRILNVYFIRICCKT